MKLPAVSNLRRTMFALVLALCAASAVSPAWSQPKAIRMVIAFPAGGPVDFVGRSISDALGKELGAQVIVENRPGANGIIAAEYVIKAPADGSVLWFTSVGAVAINPGLYQNLPYDPRQDLAPISLVVRNDELLVVGNANPATGPTDFVANAKRQRTTMATSGIGSVPHLAAELLASATGADLVGVPYKGAAPAITDVIAGHVDGFFGDVPGLISNVRAGKLKPIAMAANERHPLLPDVKTFREVGIEGVDSDNWYALFTTRGTPRAEIDRINQAVRRVLADEAVKARVLNSGAVPSPSTPEELAERLNKDSAKWARIIKDKNIKAD